MRLKVLIAEDDPLQASALASLLESRGYYVDLVGNGRDALRRIGTGMFQVALIDYRLPEIDGRAIARVARNLRGESGRTRLVALTAAPQHLAGNTAEFDEILAKPVTHDLLFQAIERGRPAGGVSSRQAPGSPDLGCTAADAVPPAPAATGGNRGRILLADDDPEVRDFLRLTLTHHGFEVDVGEDGLNAVERIQTGAYDLVIVDFNMPRLDGLAAAKIIYDLIGRQTRPRIIALTSAPNTLVAQDPAWYLVLDAIVSKSDGVPALLLAVENCIGYKATRSKSPLELLDLPSLAALVASQADPSEAGAEFCQVRAESLQSQSA